MIKHQKLSPIRYAVFHYSSLYMSPPHGESIKDMTERVSSFVEDIEKQENKTIFVQTHGYVLQVLYSCMLDKSILAIAKSPHYSNCDVVHYTYHLGKWTLD